jgi:hypothetical protein
MFLVSLSSKNFGGRFFPFAFLLQERCQTCMKAILQTEFSRQEVEKKQRKRNVVVLSY